jgi:hypothetical protein
MAFQLPLGFGRRKTINNRKANVRKALQAGRASKVYNAIRGAQSPYNQARLTSFARSAQKNYGRSYLRTKSSLGRNAAAAQKLVTNAARQAAANRQKRDRETREMESLMARFTALKGSAPAAGNWTRKKSFNIGNYQARLVTMQLPSPPPIPASYYQQRRTQSRR